jgi:hypothetical protein
MGKKVKLVPMMLKTPVPRYNWRPKTFWLKGTLKRVMLTRVQGANPTYDEGCGNGILLSGNIVKAGAKHKWNL